MWPSAPESPEGERYAVIGESGGTFDYSVYARDAFHKWLEQRFGSIGKLNELWRTNYTGFADVALPKTPAPEQNKAAWFAFREFWTPDRPGTSRR